MTSSSQPSDSFASDRVKHKKALENGGTRQLLDALRIEWTQLSLVKRGFRLQALVDAGCTNRGLADDLNCTEGTIRRGLKIAKLGESQRQAIEQGANAVPILKAAEDATRQHQRDFHIRSEQERNAAIAELEETVHEFLDQEMVRSSSERFQILDWVEHQIFDPCTIYRPNPVRPKPPAMPFKTFLESCRPKLNATEREETIRQQVIADQLTSALRYGANGNIVPEVLRRAMKSYEGRIFRCIEE